MRASEPARAAWGWHALSDDWAQRLVAASGVRQGDLVLDVGAGTGAITAHLIAAGARVLAIELHPGRAAVLKRRFDGAAVTVVQVDARRLLLPHRPFKVVANPPFAISSALLHTLLQPGSQLKSADLVLQRAVVTKFSGVHRGRWIAEERIRLPRGAFHPRPPVDASVLHIGRRR